MESNKSDILLAFSGGIDSCAAVDILRAEGWNVRILTMDMVGDTAMMDQARESAARLGLELKTIDARERFQRYIVENFTSEYLSGRTPAPCTRCNTHIKWQILAEEADRMGIYHIATGHYFKVSEHNGLRYVSRARDPNKDQSYYLWGVTEATLRRAVTPMGQMIKSEVREQSHIRKESMGICFLGGRHYTEFLCERCGEMPHGEIIDSKGEVIGEHNGVARYTIGQRRGEGIPEGLRVVESIASRNQIRVGSNDLLYTDTIRIGECHFIDSLEVIESSKIEVMVRGIGRNPSGYASVAITPYGAKITLLSDKAWAIAAGQPVVLYIGDRVVGGGYVL